MVDHLYENHFLSKVIERHFERQHSHVQVLVEVAQDHVLPRHLDRTVNHDMGT